MLVCITGWQKLREGAKGVRRKVWTRTKILTPNIRYFCRDIKVCRKLRTFTSKKNIQNYPDRPLYE